MTARSTSPAIASACAVCGVEIHAGAAVCPQCGAAQVRPAGVAARMAALTLDVAAVAIVGSIVLLASRSMAFAAVAAAEATLALWILQARAGLGLGNAVMRLRTARVDKPYSPGGGRALVRGAFTAVGLAVFAVGAWLLELTGVADRSGWRRSWADRAAGTVVVEVPRLAAPEQAATRARAASSSAPSAAPAEPAIARPAAGAGLSAAARRATGLVTDVPGARVPAAPPVAPPLTPAPAGAPGPRRSTAVPVPPVAAAPPAARTAAQPLAPGVPERQVPVASPPTAAAAPVAASTPPDAAPSVPGSRRARRAATGDVPVMPAAPGPRRSGAQSSSRGAQTVLFAFDTGQRLEAPVPCAVVLGRHPSPMEDGDLVITVDDPQRTVSSLHARLEVGVDDAWVTDLGSTNGSDLITEDGAAKRLVAQQRARVEDGTRVRIGDRALTLTRLAGDDA
ncbi:FHA domain-containing protein [Microbacterium horticulturae]|uniref:FHA domain-containing protein n=1 Tax=Microbacterium horticulturae TaxID=3028316 RepID=A0ABY8BYR8_9MICO|nr:FHA domain-containing protein [Microbacterium sp. KACC 23027]WEG08257.1 FHA domain-containing protein [Microbacterium sp. KACC 23027]